MAVVTITNDNFEQEVLAAKIPVVLDFWAIGVHADAAPVFEAGKWLEAK